MGAEHSGGSDGSGAGPTGADDQPANRPGDNPTVLRSQRSAATDVTPPAEQPQPAAYERQRAQYGDLEWREVQRGRRPGDAYVRIVRPVAREFQQVRPLTIWSLKRRPARHEAAQAGPGRQRVAS